jgi:2-iminoacetate synthase
MSFYDLYKLFRDRDILLEVESTTNEDGLRAIHKPRLSAEDFLCLLSAAAEAHFERMADKAHALTVSQFGRTMVL